MADYTNIVIGGASVFIGADLGYIKEGIAITPEIELYMVEGIEGLLTSPVARRTKESYSIAFNLLEVTQANLKIGWDITNAVGAGPDPLPLEFGGDSFKPQERVLKVYGYVPGGNDYQRTIQFDRAVVSAVGEFKITQFGEAQISSTFTCLWDESNTRLGIISDAAS